jgi:hypothetical protein
VIWLLCLVMAGFVHSAPARGLVAGGLHVMSLLQLLGRWLNDSRLVLVCGRMVVWDWAVVVAGCGSRC